MATTVAPVQIYVAPDVTSGDGSTSKPYPLGPVLQKRINSLPDGSKVRFLDGEYRLTGSLILRSAGVTYEAVNRHGARLYGPPVGSMLEQQDLLWHGLIANAPRVAIRGFQIDSIPYNGINLSAPDTWVDDCVIFDCGKSRDTEHFGGQGVLVQGAADRARVTNSKIGRCKEHAVYVTTCLQVEVSGNELHECGYNADGSTTDQGGDDSGAAGLQINGTGNPDKPQGNTGAKFINNLVWGHSSTGIMVLYGSDALIEGNTVYGNGKSAISLAMGSKRNIVRSNQAVSTKREVLNISFSAQKTYGPCAENQILGNLLYAAGASFPCIPVMLDGPDAIRSASGNRFRSPVTFIATVGGMMHGISLWRERYNDPTSVQEEPFRMHPSILSYLTQIGA